MVNDNFEYLAQDDPPDDYENLNAPSEALLKAVADISIAAKHSSEAAKSANEIANSFSQDPKRKEKFRTPQMCIEDGCTDKDIWTQKVSPLIESLPLKLRVFILGLIPIFLSKLNHISRKLESMSLLGTDSNHIPVPARLKFKL